MKITIQPTHLPNLADGEQGVTVNCHKDDGTEIVLFNAVYDGSTLTAVNGTRKMPDNPTAEGAIDVAAEVLASRFELPAPAASAIATVTAPTVTAA